MTQEEVDRPVEVPVPEDRDDHDMYIDDVLLTEVADLPDGWILVDDHMELADAWVVQNLRKNEASERSMTSEERAMMTQAKAKELTQFFQNEVWEFADNLTQGDLKRTITARWVLTWKTDEETGLPKAKARLVLRGFEDPDLTKMKTASPAAGRTARQIFLTIAGNNMWLLIVGDVIAAFLSGSGHEFKRMIIAKLPADCGPILGVTGPCYMKMNKSAYGLSDAPLLWFNEASRRLKKMDIHPQKLDNCFFAWYDRSGALQLLLLLHVDDMLIGYNPNSAEAKQKVEEIHTSFNFGKWKMLKKNEKIAYCGGVLQYVNGELCLSFEEYLRKIAPMTVDKKRGEGPMTDKEVSRARGLIGALQWPAGQGCPPMCSSTSILAGELASREARVMNELNKTLRFGKQNADVALRFPVIAEDWRDIHFIVYSDAALGVRQDLASQGGYLILAVNRKVLEGEVGRYSVVAWRSYKLTRVCRSSLAAESQACATAIDELMMVKMLYSMVKDTSLTIKDNKTAGGPKSAVIIDARALYDAINKETIQSSLDKRVAIESLVIRDGLKHTNSDLRWVSSERQLADGLTKISGRQPMCDLLRGGYVQLIYDSTFTAAKKKTQEERKEVKKVSRGTAVAMYVSTVVATQVAGATAAYSDALVRAEFKVIEYVNDPEGFINVDNITVIVFAIAIILILIYVFAKFFVPKNDNMRRINGKVMVDQEIQIAAGGETNIATITYDEQMQLGAYIGQLEENNEKYKREVFENLEQYVHHIDDMSMRQMREQQDLAVWATSHGERWHSNPMCPTIKDRNPKQLTFCQRCKAASEESSFSPM